MNFTPDHNAKMPCTCISDEDLNGYLEEAGLVSDQLQFDFMQDREPDYGNVTIGSG